MTGLDIFYVTMLGISAIVIVWFAVYSVYRLYSGQR
jgi:hypothetical protein